MQGTDRSNSWHSSCFPSPCGRYSSRPTPNRSAGPRSLPFGSARATCARCQRPPVLRPRSRERLGPVSPGVRPWSRGNGMKSVLPPSEPLDYGYPGRLEPRDRVPLRSPGHLDAADRAAAAGTALPDADPGYSLNDRAGRTTSSTGSRTLTATIWRGWFSTSRPASSASRSISSPR